MAQHSRDTLECGKDAVVEHVLTAEKRSRDGITAVTGQPVERLSTTCVGSTSVLPSTRRHRIAQILA